jgi:3-deoxy-7-phosphoheptulonate synthase
MRIAVATAAMNAMNATNADYRRRRSGRRNGIRWAPARRIAIFAANRRVSATSMSNDSHTQKVPANGGSDGQGKVPGEEEVAGRRAVLDALDAKIHRLLGERDALARELINVKDGAPYDPAREDEIAGRDEELWLPILRRVRTAEGARLARAQSKPGAFPESAFTMIAGPCAVDECLEANLELVAAAGIKWARAGAFKPRTFSWSFQGRGAQGLCELRAAADRHGLKIVSEVMSEADAAGAVGMVDVVQVGARNCQNFALLKRLAKLGKPVLLKRGASCTVEEWLGAASYLDGRVPVTLCERGIRAFDPCFRNLLDLPGALLAQRLGGYQTIVDPSHGTGIAGLITPLVLAARAAGLDGAMVEVHVSPDRSPSDGEQALRPEELRELMTLLESFHSVAAR